MIAALLVMLAFSAAAESAVAGDAADPFADCRRDLAGRPTDYESAYCFYQTALNRRLLGTVPAVLEALIAEQPGNFWLPLTLGHVLRGQDAGRAEAMYRRAAEGFAGTGHDEGELLARISLRDMLFPIGRAEDAGREVDRVVAIAARTTDAILRARARVTQANQLQDTGGDLGVAYRLLEEAERPILTAGPYRLKRTLLSTQGSVAFRLGRFDEALATFAQLDALAASAGEARLRASAQYNIFNTTSMQEMLLPSDGGRARLAILTERALATAIAAQSDELAAKGHRAMAELLAAEPAAHAKALDHAQRCLTLASMLRLQHDEAMCSWVLATLLSRRDPRAGAAAERRAVDATTRANNPRTDAYSAGRRMRLSWDTKPRAGAISDALAAIDTIERLRRLQETADSSAELFSAWTQDYYWLAGRLLERAAEGDLERAFAVSERMRGRGLLDSLIASRAPLAASPGPDRRRAALDAIAALQRTLLDRRLDVVQRRRRLAELEAAERQLQDAEWQIGVSGERSAIAPSFADLATVQATLGDNEALLAFQVGLWETVEGQFGGGSWLVMLTRTGRAVFRLPDRAALAPLVPVFNGLLARDDGLERAAAARLYDLLLAPALGRLPPTVTRLVLVPDAMLHDLPFDALRATRDAPPLAARYQMVVAPSATLWHRWRNRQVHGAPQRALAFADPQLSVPLEADALERNVTLQRGLQLGRLPYARSETRAMARHLGTVDVLAGDRASEHALKARDLGGYGLLHFAAHAVADEGHPARSAVLLAPGDAREDGLLQAREIEGLDLAGRVIVLSACRTADGVIRSGEGTLSLARAFFAAGAPAVIGSRWPIRDEDAAWFFTAFYRHVGAGATLAEALAHAKVDAIADGRPATAWAGVVLFGDGEARLVPGGREPSRVAPVTGVLVTAGALFGLAVFLRARRTGASRSTRSRS